MKGELLPAPVTVARLAEGVAIHRGVRLAGEGFGRHTHDYHSITVLLSSPGTSTWCYGGGKSRSIRQVAGDVFFCPAHVPTAVHTEKAFESVLLCLSPNRFSRVASSSARFAGQTRTRTTASPPAARVAVADVHTELADQWLTRDLRLELLGYTRLNEAALAVWTSIRELSLVTLSDWFRCHQKRNKQAAKSHKKHRHKCVI